MKLELKHLAPYLPYGLKFEYFGDVWTTVSIHFMRKFFITGTMRANNNRNFLFQNIKPILRPLSDLTKEIAYHGENEIGVDYICTSNRQAEQYMETIPKNQFNCDALKWWQFEILLEMHVDVFGLIDAGIAIDINTLEAVEA